MRPIRYAFIVNPIAGNGRAAAIAALLPERMARRGHSVEVAIPGSGPEAETEAAKLGGRADVVVAVGGDGTVHRVASGLASGSSGAALAILPVGTGNDFARSIGMPTRWRHALDAIIAGTIKPCDSGTVSFSGEGASGSSRFINVAGIGFDAVVADRAPRFAPLPGLARYTAAALSVLRTWSAIVVEVRSEDDEQPVLKGPLFLMSVGNGPRAGGGFKLTPEASIVDGALDACVVQELSTRRALHLLPLAVLGRHVTAPEVKMCRSAEFRIQSSSPLVLHADGEVIDRTVTEAVFRVEPGRLRLVLPKNRVRER